MKKYLLIGFLLCLVITSACAHVDTLQNESQEQEILNTIYLVRHAEKTKQQKDPGLTFEGNQRALELSKLLSDKNLSSIHSSDYIRTKETARPTAELFNLDVQLYDPRNLHAMSIKLKALRGTHLVVGHSNTTPQLVELLGGDPVSEINEAKEYDRLYTVIIRKDGIVSNDLSRYGKLYTKD